jgi:D-ribose pyranase
MIKNGILHPQLASLLARFRHVNAIAIVDGPFPTYPNVETIELAITMGWPTIPQVLDEILPYLDITSLVLANEFEEKVDKQITQRYIAHHKNIPTTKIAHSDFKVQVGQCLGIIHTGDAVPYSSVILKSG